MTRNETWIRRRSKKTSKSLAGRGELFCQLQRRSDVASLVPCTLSFVFIDVLTISQLHKSYCSEAKWPVQDGQETAFQPQIVARRA